MEKIKVFAGGEPRYLPDTLRFNIIEELPLVGDVFDDRVVQEVTPYIPNTPQEDPNVFSYAYWFVRFKDSTLYLAAVREPEGDTL